MFACLSVCMGHFGSHWMDFYEILCYEYLLQIYQNLNVLVKSDKNNWYFT